MSNKAGSYITPLQEVQLSEHEKWTEKACDINELMQAVGKPDDLPLGVSIVWYALDRLHKELSRESQSDKEE